MRIAFLSSLDPYSVRNWSGTLYHIFHSLRKNHSVDWIGKEILGNVQTHHMVRNGREIPFIPERYTPLIGELCSKRINETLGYDVIIARDYFFIAYLKTNIPLIYIGDTTFDLFKDYMGVSGSRFARLADDIENRAISNADWIVYSSEWAKNNAITHYGAEHEKIEVIEFGANISEIFTPEKITIPDTCCCNLLFIGRNWEYKGGKKTYDTYRLLKKDGFNCSLSIIGCNPVNIVDTSDPQLQIIPFIDKSKEEDLKRLDNIFRSTHFFILPTIFDCFGIVFCEASAYGIPSLASDVGGVHQVIRNGRNGYLLSTEAKPEEYVQIIQETFNDSEKYRELRLSSRDEFEKRLNWQVWEKKMNQLLQRAVTLKKENMNKTEEQSEFYIPTYVISSSECTDYKIHISKEFKNKEEFDVTYIDAYNPQTGEVELWGSIVKIIRASIEREDDVIIICSDNHYFTEYYSKEYLIDNILQAYGQGADVLFGGIDGFDYAVPVAKNRYWVNRFGGTQFIVVFRKFFRQILDYEFKDKDMVDTILFQLSNNLMTLYPFISRQKELGCHNAHKKNDSLDPITYRFEQSEAHLAAIHKVSSFYNYPNFFDNETY